MTVTLDRSIFHGDNYRRLRESPLADLCAQGLIVVHHSAVLMEETLRLWHTAEKRSLLRDQVGYLLTVGNGRFYRPTRELLAAELGWLQPAPDYAFEPTHAEPRIRQGLAREFDAILSRNPPDLENARERNRNRTTRLLSQRHALREKVAGEFRAGRVSAKEILRFEQFYGDNVEEATRLNVERLLPLGRTVEEIMGEWRTASRQYPYLDLWVKGGLFLAYHAGAHHSDAIDKNDQWDMELLLIAKDIDVVVSDDRGMRKLFYEFYNGTAKEILTLDEFLERLARLAPTS